MNEKWIVGGALVLLAAIGLVGCAVEAQEDDYGSLEMAVRATGSSGIEYGLGATFALTGPQAQTITTNYLDPTSILSVTPRVGSYQLTLCAGLAGGGGCAVGTPTWQLYTLSCSGAPVATCPAGALVGTAVSGATLVGAATRTVAVKAFQTTTVVYEFQVPGTGNVVFATGNLDVDVTVTEGFANGTACTTATQCQSKVCSGMPLTCTAPTCTDGVLNGTETGADCGGTCSACPTACVGNTDCAYNQVCINQLCLAGTAVSCTAATVAAACGPARTCSSASGGAATTCAAQACTSGAGGMAVCPAGFVCTTIAGANYCE